MPDVGRAVQAAIYRAGSFGRRPRVPTDGTALEDAARGVMSKRSFAYVAGSAGGESTARPNHGGFARWQVPPRVPGDTGQPDLGVDLLGRRHPTPFPLAPIGRPSSAQPGADRAAGRGAREQGVTPV